MSKSSASEKKRISRVSRLLGPSAQKLAAGTLARYSPVVRYIAIGVWVYRKLKKRSIGQSTKITLKPGDAFEIRSKLRK